MGTDMMGMANELDRIPSTTLAALRGILVKSLSRENLSLTDQQLLVYRKDRHVSFNVAGNRDANVQKQTRPSSANKDNRPHSVAHTLHWFACVGEDYDINGFNNEEEQQKEREERIKQIKERQNEERQRKLEELKAQALAAQKFREQKEEERRRRMEDLRRRENDRRSQVEERRRAIQEADNERRQYILQKNQERDQRMETKRRNERSSIQFAFGSSTPRMIESGDSGMSSSFWTNRRATSITNVAYTGAPLTRRSSERELTDGSSKKRATSASGLDRSTDDDSADMSYQRTVNRRKTDLMPTIPSPRDSSRSSLGTHTPRTPGLRSGEITPNSLNASRPGSAMSSSTTASGIVYRRSIPASLSTPRKPRPFSIAVTGVSAGVKEEKPPLPKTSATSSSASSTTMERKRPQSGTSTPAKPPTAPDSAKKHSVEKQRVSSARGTPKAASTPLQSPGPEKANRSIHDSLQQKQSTLPVTLVKQGSSASAKSTEEKVENGTPKQPVEAVVQSETVTTVVETAEKQQQQEQTIITEIKVEETHVESEIVEKIPQVPNQLEVSNHEEKRDETKDTNSLEPEQNGDGSNVDLMTASMHAKRISTEEEAKAALAERRRLAREEAERQAELERQRIEAEEEAERQRQLEEEERLRMLEEETIRLGEEQRRLEEERLQQAIEEAKKRDEEERLRREEEARQKVEREESERKAREEAERQRIEMAERLKKEEKEREERRKRVEAIMSRTRAKGSANNTPTKQSDDNREDVMSKSEIVTSSATTATNVDTTMSMTESMLESVSQQHPEAESVSQVPAEASEKVDLLAQDVQTLVLVEDGDDQNQQNNNNNSSLNNNHNNNSMDTAIITNASAEYERSVTEKENYLLGSFNNNLNSNVVASNGGDSDIGSSQQPSSLESSSTPVGVTTNGKSTPGATTIAETTELIIEDAIMSGQTNGHKNGSIDNVFAQIPSAVEGSPKFLVHFDTGSHSDELALSPAAGIVESSEHYPLLETPSTNTATTAAAAAQLIDFGSFQSLTEEVQPQSAAIVDHDPFNLNNNNNYNNASSSENLIDSSSFGTSSSPTATSLFTGSDINMISNSNFLNNNATRLVATSDSQDNRDLSLL
ncbi:bromodomain-containing protein DDB_G0270170-like isoform X11 [Topomyia yanbarensis]|uniref:bromodomain-containing protein DDB_G0270170-like isoform X11 n=1 Tax=Topomyia yanbarensis TaxID=2498891 RepID=UPI00273BA491|nr:bromodomain-containing protein DDB_G0270170-like isoform X11 [Topomyia yanbarensis]XP_058840227.1 bromodomain-containing protein DDB_G0270170-like isoform X11 [Topomyia yanbarensis]